MLLQHASAHRYSFNVDTHAAAVLVSQILVVIPCKHSLLSVHVERLSQVLNL